jgi:hypothetical protein
VLVLDHERRAGAQPNGSRALRSPQLVSANDVATTLRVLRFTRANLPESVVRGLQDVALATSAETVINVLNALAGAAVPLPPAQILDGDAFADLVGQSLAAS